MKERARNVRFFCRMERIKAAVVTATALIFESARRVRTAEDDRSRVSYDCRNVRVL